MEIKKRREIHHVLRPIYIVTGMHIQENSGVLSSNEETVVMNPIHIEHRYFVSISSTSKKIKTDIMNIKLQDCFSLPVI